ncbi:MAG TPA: hypothetical protein VG055_19725 [Planctomycetaceae bacterium]|jgi:hypothetical protein|nr:hypothetical protein [Planctomycetaceae bacterium]
MGDEPRKRSRAWIGWILLAVFVVYPLSAGPALWIADRFECWDAVYCAYFPLVWPLSHFPPLFDVLIWYLRFFADLPT